ncbi:MAG: PRC-barrel domain-containing protein [Pseudonocardiales bacterium]|nr:PRC-barrel domain-containing protein [Pseudonocardiales bacterium]MBV9649302.1 PRC-barrel domain-containing protein [Pseudonocardiales bacterium]
MITPAPALVLRASELIGRPVVTLGGELVAEIKDVVFEHAGGRIAGFTLRNPGLFSRSRKDALPWAGVHGVGRDAVMVADETVFIPAKELAPRKQARKADVLQDRVLTDNGRDLGRVVDVVLHGGTSLEVVGYEVQASETLGTAGQRVLIPLPDTMAVSGEHLIVPAAATEFVSEDLAGFGAAVDAFRSRLREEAS